MRILALSRYGRAGPSSRVRFLQYIPALEAQGMKVTVAPVLDDAYIAASFSGRITAGPLLQGYLKRVTQTRRAAGFDLIWLEKELLNWMPLCVERTLPPAHVPLVIEYDDAVFHRYDHSPHFAIRAALSAKHPWLARRATTIIAGNDYLAGQLRAFGPRRVDTSTTVGSTSRYSVAAPPGGTFTVGWASIATSFALTSTAFWRAAPRNR